MQNGSIRGAGELDTLDRRILNVLQKDASLTMAELALAVASTVPTCHRRVSALRKSGALERVVAIANSDLSNEAFTIVIGIVIKSQRPEDEGRFHRFLKGHPHIKMAWMTTGEFDYIALCAFPDTNAYLNFIQSELITHANFSNFRTFVSVDQIKFDTSRSF